MEARKRQSSKRVSISLATTLVSVLQSSELVADHKRRPGARAKREICKQMLSALGLSSNLETSPTAEAAAGHQVLTTVSLLS